MLRSFSVLAGPVVIPAPFFLITLSLIIIKGFFKWVLTAE